MQFQALPLVLVMGLLNLVRAGEDMHIQFPGALRTRAENLMSFSSAIGGSAPAITQSSNADRPFSVNGDLFRTFGDAWERSCGIQKNLCGDFANSSAGRSAGVEVSKCDEQNSSCLKAEASASPKTFGTGTTGGSGSGSNSGSGTNSGSGAFVSQDANFDYYCEG